MSVTVSLDQLLKVSLVGLLVTAGSAIAAPADPVVKLLQGLGHSEIKVTRTMLGRALIVAKTRRNAREIVLNPNTGEILRDVVDRGAGTKSASVRSTQTGQGTPKTGQTGNCRSNETAKAGGDRH